MKQVLKQISGFSIMELMVAIVLMGIMASFAIPSYNKSVAKGKESDLIRNLVTLHAANTVYEANFGTYWDTGGATISNLNSINTNLNINIVASDDSVIYRYRSIDGSTYTATGAWGGFRIAVTQDPISATNPSCALAPCPSL